MGYAPLHSKYMSSISIHKSHSKIKFKLAKKRKRGSISMNFGVYFNLAMWHYPNSNPSSV